MHRLPRNGELNIWLTAGLLTLLSQGELPSRQMVGQWRVVRLETDNSQQRDCTGFSPVSLLISHSCEPISVAKVRIKAVTSKHVSCYFSINLWPYWLCFCNALVVKVLQKAVFRSLKDCLLQRRLPSFVLPFAVFCGWADVLLVWIVCCGEISMLAYSHCKYGRLVVFMRCGAEWADMKK